MRVSHSDDDGVIGYQVTTVTPAIMQPMAAAALPSTRMRPRFASIGSMKYGSRFSRCSSAKAKPMSRASRLRATTLGLLPNCLRTAASISSRSTPSRRDSTPSYNMLRTRRRSLTSRDTFPRSVSKGTG